MLSEVKFCRNCGSEVKVESVSLGYDDKTGKPISSRVRYCPTLSQGTIRKAYLNGTLCLGGYYHKDHFLQEEDE